MNELMNNNLIFIYSFSKMSKYSGKKCRLLSMMWLTAFFFFVEIIVGYVTNSMALVADSFHMLGDIAALVISFLSVKVSKDSYIFQLLSKFWIFLWILNYCNPSQMSPKKWSKNTFGWARAEVLGALVNAVFLVALCFSITIEACKRWDTCFSSYINIHICCPHPVSDSTAVLRQIKGLL